MTLRITRADLEGRLQRLHLMGFKRYGIQGAYGRVQLVAYENGTDSKDGIHDISYLQTKRELYDILVAITRLLELEGCV